ncbi:MAG: hypothetical protein ACI4J0_06760 [Huintestinicola sp.]|uniref:hypothetical protein n=1 Tax=Huintestinicola sp. TaxID=2981661 RepID=UPI003F034DEC
MDNMNDMLGSVLGDPESLQQIKELADLLKSETESGSETEQPARDPSEDSSGGFDPAMLMGLMGAVSAAGSDDKNRALILALKPYLSSERQAKADKAVKLLKMYAVFSELKKSGMLGNLDKLL